MTTQKTLKRQLRVRMDRTGESYTADRRQLIEGRVRASAASGGSRAVCREGVAEDRPSSFFG